MFAITRYYLYTVLTVRRFFSKLDYSKIPRDICRGTASTTFVGIDEILFYNQFFY